MDDKNKKTLGIGLGALAIVGLGVGLSKIRGKPAPGVCPDPTTHWDGQACVANPVDGEPLNCAAGYHPNEDNTACVPDIIEGNTPDAIWARANILTTPPNLEITDFHLTNVYAEAKLSVFPVDEWWNRLNSESDAVIVETQGDPYHMPVTYARLDANGNWQPVGSFDIPPVGTRVGQLRGHTWGSRLTVYEWDGSKWNQVFLGSLGPNQGWQTPPQYDIAEGVITIKSNVDWPMPPNLVTYNIRVNLQGSTNNSRYYCFNQSQYISETLAAGQAVSIPIILRAYAGSYSDYQAGTPMQQGNYIAVLWISFCGMQISYKADWYNPPHTQADPVMWDNLQSGTRIISYSISYTDLTAECRKIWRQDSIFGSYRVIFAYPLYDQIRTDLPITGPQKSYSISVSQYGES